MIEVNYVYLEKLEISNSYLIMDRDSNKSLSDYRGSDNKLYLIEIKEKLENSVLVFNHNTNEESWYSSHKMIVLFDHVPIKYLRKKKLDIIDKK